jgi:DEAD/DEAH box helicase domain-containing protein
MLEETERDGWIKDFGELKVTSKVVGYRKVRWYTNENLGEGLLELPPTELVTTGYWITLEEKIISPLREQGLWNGDSNNYGSDWDKIRLLVRKHDSYTCQVCGKIEAGKSHHVHHKIPFRMFKSTLEANRLENLVTLCPQCHQRVEVNLRIRSGLSGLCYVLQHLAPLFLMCDINDLGAYSEPQSPLSDGKPVVAIYDMVPAGIGLSKKLFEIDTELISEAKQLVENCSCQDGCPSCVGPGGENGQGGKKESLALLSALTASMGLG